MHADYGALGKRESFVFKPAQLTMPYIAALTPPEIEVSISDEMTGPINLENDADLVAITFVTPFAHRAYELSAEFKKRGKTVIFGGPHASLMPQEAKGHCDAVIVGEADETWPLMLEDFKGNNLKPFYRAAPPSLASLPFARRDLLKKNNYIVPDVVQATRGCPFKCDFCALGLIYGHGQRQRPVDDVIKEIETFERNTFIFWDDNIVGNPGYAKELFRRLAPLKKKWLGQGSLTVTADEGLLQLASKSGCISLFVGVESISQESLETVNKGFNKISRLKDAIKKFHHSGISVFAGMIFGFDTDDKHIFERTVETAVKVAIDGISFSILTPYPGTVLFKKMESEGRMLHYDWSRYNSEHVVFKPKGMTGDELQLGHNWANRNFYSIPSIIKRLAKSRTQLGLTTKLNFADRKYSHNRFKS